MTRPAVFVDRDGTIARDVHYCRRPEDFELFPGVARAIHRLNTAGFLVVVITNQSGIGRGYFTEDTLHSIHARMLSNLAREGARLDGIYYCPHHPTAGCNCRKPKPALLHRAAHELDIDLGSSFMIGDMPLDVEAGRGAGCATVLVSNTDSGNLDSSGADFVAADFTQAVECILSQQDSEAVRLATAVRER